MQPDWEAISREVQAAARPEPPDESFWEHEMIEHPDPPEEREGYLPDDED